MSDCRNGGRGTYAVPKPVEQATIKRMCREFGPPPWTYPVDKPECWPDEAVELVGAIEFGGKRFVRVRTCEDMGRYCFTCSKCGWTANEPRHVFGGFWPKFCPHCGAKVRGGGDEL